MMSGTPVFQELLLRKLPLAVIGLGYAGLPLALEFATHLRVVGFDIEPRVTELLKQGIDPVRQIDSSAFIGKDILFTHDPDDLKEACFFVLALPTPVDRYKVPDLSYLKKASATVAGALKKDDYIIFESTVYPGCTEEDCIPLIEKLSGLKAGIDFKYGYSPERINPGDKIHTLTNTVKLVAGCDEVALNEIAKLYELIITAGVYKAPSIKVAEAAKIIENIQRDLNISLMNELSVIFDKMGINTLEVIEAAGTKWNFMKFFPGLVGGHCIGVDPYYLTYKAQQLGYDSRVIAAGRFVNDDIPQHVAKKLLQHIIKNTKDLSQARILVLGATFKENISDIRNSKVADLVKDLLDYSLQVDWVDEKASSEDINRHYGLMMTENISTGYDAVVLAVAHDNYKNFTEDYIASLLKPDGLFADLKGIYRNKLSAVKYWSL